MNNPWQIQLLGGLSARKGDHCITRFATSRAAALLARLALHPKRTHPREELADLLWPDADLDAGRLNLRVCLASLRRQLEPPGTLTGSVLIADRTTVRLNPAACQSDAAEFETALREATRAQTLEKKREALEYALGFYGGELLPGFYDEWILEERERLEAVREQAQLERDSLPPPKLPLDPLPEAAPAEHAAPALLERAPLPMGFPLQFTRFFGREAERARLAEMLCDPEVSLVTLIGPGGAGKTRLALETARQAAGSFRGLACFVPLADISDSALIPVSIAAVLRLPLSSESTPQAQVAAHLAGLPSLLVLDNMEHLGEDGAAQTRALLAETPGLTCLVTSRRRLDLEGERELFLRSLPVPGSASEEDETPAALALLPSVQLFVDRAQAVRPDFQVTPHNAASVAAICRSLEGIPLALELAAARVQTLTPAQMQTQLAARLDFLTSRRRDLPARHRSLRAALEWSTQLLTPEQLQFFVRLSVFRGGCTLESAQAVCESPEALDLLEQLRERSLIVAEEPDEAGLAMRFRMLEALREFGAEQLSGDEGHALSCRHAHYCEALAARMDALWDGPEQEQGRATLEAEYDNLRAALTFCRTDETGGATGLRLAASLGHFWVLRGLLREGLDWLDAALARPGPDDARAAALARAGYLHAGTGNYGPALEMLSEAISLGRGLGGDPILRGALRMRGVTFSWSGDSVRAAQDYEEALALGRLAGDEVTVAIMLNNLAILTEQRKDLAGAQRLYEEALAVFQKLGSRRRIAHSLHNLGNVAHELGDYDRAAAMLTESLALADAVGDEWHRAYCLRSLGDVWKAQGEITQAVRTFEEGIALCRRLGDRMSEAGTALSLAHLYRHEQNFAEAEFQARAALLLYQDLEHAEGRSAGWLGLAEVAADQSQWSRAACFLSAAALCWEMPPDATDYAHIRSLHEAAQTALGADAFAAAWEQGLTFACDAYGLHHIQQP